VTSTQDESLLKMIEAGGGSKVTVACSPRPDLGIRPRSLD